MFSLISVEDITTCLFCLTFIVFDFHVRSNYRVREIIVNFKLANLPND